MANHIAKVYADLIRKHNKTLDEVPEKIKKEVEAALKELEVQM